MAPPTYTLSQEPPVALEVTEPVIDSDVLHLRSQHLRREAEQRLVLVRSNNSDSEDSLDGLQREPRINTNHAPPPIPFPHI